MTRYKPEGFSDSYGYVTVDDAIEAAKRSNALVRGGTTRIYAITHVATVSSTPSIDYTITKEPTNV